jgi:hypothetical protein
MNATMNQYDDGTSISFKVQFRMVRTPVAGKQTSRPSHSRRRGRGPQLFNGIHRRRHKKISW